MESKSLNIIPVKFGEIPPSGLGDILYNKLLTDNGRRDDGHPMITIAHHNPMAQVS